MRTEARGTSVTQATPTENASLDSALRQANDLGILSPSSKSEVPSTQNLVSPHVPARYVVFFALATFGVAWDLWSKSAVFDWLGLENSYHVWKGSVLGISIQFDLVTACNRGALWGIGQGMTWLFASLSVLAVAVIGFFVWTRQVVSSWWLTIASGLLLAGTLGNLFDRLGLHHLQDEKGPIYAVRDFLDFVFFEGGFHWATFNFADTYLVTGAIMLGLQSFWQQSETADPRQTMGAE